MTIDKDDNQSIQKNNFLRHLQPNKNILLTKQTKEEKKMENCFY